MENEPLHILLADDDENDRLIFTEAFAELEIKSVVDTVKDGMKLMERLRDRTIPLPDLLFLDLNMPRKDGLECLKEIRSDKKLKGISIAIYSTSGNKKDLEETFLNGANIYVIKPSSFSKLKTVLGKTVMTAFQYQDEKLKRENFLLLV